MLAAERTFASWLRTGLAFLGAGLVAQRFLREVLSVWPLKLLSAALVACAPDHADAPRPCRGRDDAARDHGRGRRPPDRDLGARYGGAAMGVAAGCGHGDAVIRPE